MSSKCDINLLLTAQKAAYCNVSGASEFRYRKPFGNKSLEAHFKDNGYMVCADKAPAIKSKSALGAVALKPIDPNDNGPIVIAFRGTKESNDLLEDVNLTLDGKIGDAYRKEAFSFYQNVKMKNPGRSIVLTGHSLGGHIAQDVAQQAFQRADKDLFVRTFDSAEIKVTGAGIKQVSPTGVPTLGLGQNFINYRMCNDPVSKVGYRVGNTVTIRAKDIGRLDALKAHKVDTLFKHMPADLKSQTVGSHDELNRFREGIIGMRENFMSASTDQNNGVNITLKNCVDIMVHIIDGDSKNKKTHIMDVLSMHKKLLDSDTDEQKSKDNAIIMIDKMQKDAERLPVNLREAKVSEPTAAEKAKASEPTAAEKVKASEPTVGSNYDIQQLKRDINQLKLDFRATYLEKNEDEQKFHIMDKTIDNITDIIDDHDGDKRERISDSLDATKTMFDFPQDCDKKDAALSLIDTIKEKTNMLSENTTSDKKSTDIKMCDEQADTPINTSPPHP